MKTKLLFLLFLASLPSFAQYTLIPDVNFEKKLIALGIDSGTADGKVLTASVSSVTSLNVSYRSITDLTGIQDFVALTSLNCESNQLINLDVSKNTVLTILRCYNNQLTNLDVSKNTVLTILRCNYNKLMNLNISNNIALTDLDYSNNYLTNLNISNNVALTSLNCSDNQITDLDISKHIALKTLTCDLNKLTSLDVSKNTALTSLSCMANQLTNLNISNNTDLRGLSCDFNDQLINLDISKNVSLIFLSCQCKLMNLDVSKNISLQQLYCNYNQLTSLDVSKNIELTDLGCSNNQLTSLDCSNNTSLEHLDCSGNQLTSLNLRNGNNTNSQWLAKSYGDFFINNPNLTCIQVDDVAYANANWGTFKDATASFSTSCPTLGIADSVFNTIAVYPNPTKGEVHIDNVILEKATVYDVLGKLVKTKTFTNSSNNNSINLAGLPSSIYYIYLESQSTTIVKKIIVD